MLIQPKCYQPGPRLIGHTNAVLGLAFSPNGFFLASVGIDGKFIIWRADEGTEISRTCSPVPFCSVVWIDDSTAVAGKMDGKLFAMNIDDVSVILSVPAVQFIQA